MAKHKPEPWCVAYDKWLLKSNDPEPSSAEEVFRAAWSAARRGGQETVKMRTRGGEWCWSWIAKLGGYWLGPELRLRSMSDAMRSGNAWAKGMGLKPRWE